MARYVNTTEKGRTSMYTVQCAALVLGVSQRTIRRWIAKDGIKKVLIRTDQERVYITHNDMLMLADKNFRKLRKPDKVTDWNNVSPEQDLYTIKEAAVVLDTSVYSVRRWIKEDEIEKKFIITDRKRIYISFHDVLWLGIERRCKANGGVKTIENAGDSTAIEIRSCAEEGLYSIKKVAKILNVSEKTVKWWIQRFNIVKRHRYTDKNRTYIHHSDFLMLVHRHEMRTSQEKRNELGFYTIKDVSIMIGVAKITVRRWMRRLNIRPIRISNDKESVYIANRDVLRLADWHRERRG